MSDVEDWPSVVCLGELLIDLVATGPDPSIESATTFVKSPGGAPANVAVGLSRLGVPAAFIGKVSDDAFGGFLRATLDAEGVDTRGLVVDPSARTPLAFVGSQPSGARAWVFFHRGMADTLLRPDELDTDLIGHARIFHFGSVTLAADPGRSATLAAARLARERGCLVSFDPNVRLELWDDPDDARRWIGEAVPLADVIKVSGDEIDFLTGSDDPRAAATSLRRKGPAMAVVTLGSGGTYVQLGSIDETVPSFDVTAIDSTGAGDAFVSGLLASLIDRRVDELLALTRPDVSDAIRFANAVGALATTRIGAIPSLPTRDAVSALMGGAGGAPLIGLILP